MTELRELVISWPSLLLVLLVFGFAPGFCLRLIVLAYPRSDARRAELTAELYALPRIQRPLWVAEQLEVALFEGLAHRMSAILQGFSSRGRTRRRTIQSKEASRASLTLALLSMALVLARMFVDELGDSVGLTAAIGGVAVTSLALAARAGWRRRQHVARQPDSEE